MQPSKVYRQVPNFNLIPSEYQKPIISGQRLSLRLLLAIVIIVEILFIQNLNRDKASLEAMITSTRQQIQQIEERLNVINTAQPLEQERQALEQEGQALKNDWRQLITTQADWPRVLTALFQSRPQEIKLSAVRQDGQRLSITGIATNYNALVEYRRALLTYPAISQIASMESSQSETSVSFAMVIKLKIGEGK